MLAFLVGLLVWALGAEEPTPARPKVVAVAVTLLYAALGVGLLRLVAEGRLARMLKTVWEMPILMTLLLSAILGGMIALYRKVGQGRNWARVTLLVFFILFLPFGILDLIQRFQTNALSATLASVQELMAGGAVVLVFTPLANSWFRAVKANRKQIKTAEPSPPPLPRARGGHSEGEG
jgi:hypothetical protein